MKPLDVIMAARADGKYRCLNCQAEHTRLRGPDSLNAHLAASRRCSDAARAFRATGNVDCLDDPPYTLSAMEQLSAFRDIRDAAS